MKQVRWALVGCSAAVLILAAMCGGILFRLSVAFPPMRHDATNYDPELTCDARAALPIIAALNRYHSKHSALPADASQLVPFLPPRSFPTTDHRQGYVRGWKYLKARNGKGYVLSLRLDWDPSLGYWYDGSKGHWIFQPGDGSAEKEIILKP